MTKLFANDIGHEPRLEPPDPEPMPICPCCGQESDTFYIWMPTGEISGCGECMRGVDSWEVDENKRSF